MSDEKSTNFIRAIIEEDLKNGKNEGRIETRFPPEPNGYLHIGHAKAICINYGIASDYQAPYHLRFDDTNPTKEDVEYVNSIKEDIYWLGFDWEDREHYASDYFDQIYKLAEKLIESGNAFVCNLTAEQIREYRGTLKVPGKNSPYRERTIQENLDLFRKMRDGAFEEGECLLRAKIDMKSPNMNMRDPALYRILKADHHRTASKWCIYPMYDFTHPISDAIENITHSLCSLEFEDHRPLYDWVLDQLSELPHPRQIEFSRLNIDYTVMSKRKLLSLVENNDVEGWDDPRMPTLSGMRRRGIPPAAIRDFCDRIGVTKKASCIEIATLENCVREQLNIDSPRVMVVFDPIKVIVENYPEGKSEELDVQNHPQDPSFGSRKVPFGRELYIERADFMENPPKKFFRLGLNREVRFKYAYLLTCTEIIKDDSGKIIEIRCTYDPESKGGKAPDGRKVKGTIHWVSASHAIQREVRLYDRLFSHPNPAGEDDFRKCLNRDSLQILDGCLMEPSLAEAKAENRFQFERNGYFCADRNNPQIFNRTVTLRDSWGKVSS